MRHDHHTPAWRRLIALASLALLLTLLAIGSPAVPAHAAARHAAATGATLSLAMANGPTFTYDGSNGPATPIKFTATLVLTQKFSTSNTGQLLVKVSNGTILTNTSPPGSSSDQLTYTFSVDSTAIVNNSGSIANPGDYTAYATLTTSDPTETFTTVTSNTVSFTITKAQMSLSCGVTTPVTPGQAVTVTFSMYGGTSTPVDWTQGTGSVSFVGPGTSTQTYTTSNLQPDSSGKVTVNAPTPLGRYAVQCSFTGDSNYRSSSMTVSNVTLFVSELKPIGGIQLYTNPTTLVANTPIQMYVVIKPGSGLPAPTGQFTIYIHGYTLYYTQGITVGPNGDTLVSLGKIPNLSTATSIEIGYSGDEYYKGQSATFPLTNPAIPSGASGSSGGTVAASGGSPGSPKVTPTVTRTATPGPIATYTPTSRPATEGSVTPQAHTSGNTITVWILAILGLLFVGAGALVYVLRRRGVLGPKV